MRMSPTYILAVDDLVQDAHSNCFLELDPAPRLEVKPSDAIARVSRDPEAVPSFPSEPGKQPRTSEIFRGLGPQTATVTPSTAGTGAAPFSALTATSAGSETMFEGSLVEMSESSAASEQGPCASEWASDDDHLAESRIPWALLVLMSYSVSGHSRLLGPLDGSIIPVRRVSIGRNESD